ncbi:protein unzipped-like isoform X2 [Macrosteles quadrilineatus]|uniref:protein unzipped-like isoform X2 n=1 Tax=Macrosteles quadrilineatus TaxID=74068 RepID=UPI0023E33F35|nr:protein unzipped-like isoform X2 [Macrosteles quadrilineatus]
MKEYFKMARSGCLLITLVTLSLTSASDNSVHIYNQYPDLHITSSTLRWIGDQNGNRPDTAVVATLDIVSATEGQVDDGAVDAVKERAVHVCRARINGLWVPGRLPLNATECQVSLLGRVFSYPQYEVLTTDHLCAVSPLVKLTTEYCKKRLGGRCRSGPQNRVLENMETGARLSWVQWGRYNPLLPKGAVAGGEQVYVARRKVNMIGARDEAKVLGPRHHVGKFDPKEGIGRVIVIEGVGKDAVEKDYHEGEILVESEPTNYEITSMKFTEKRRKESRTLKELGSATLKNDQSQYTAKVDTVVAYDNLVSMYWGQGRAMLKGLNTIIRLPNGNREEIKWGIPFTEERKDVYKVEAHLEPGTAVNVTVWGNQTDSEVPYSGQLVAVYEDLQSRARGISGILREESMKELKAVFSPVYWIHNDTLVPTTTTTTTTTTSTTTTTTTRPKEIVDSNNIQGDDNNLPENSAALSKNVSKASVGDTGSGSSVVLSSFLSLIPAISISLVQRIA